MAITTMTNAAIILPGKMARDRRPARAGAFVDCGSVVFPDILQILRSGKPTEDTHCFAAMSGQWHDESRASHWIRRKLTTGVVLEAHPPF
jgi:hypothetical protein